MTPPRVAVIGGGVAGMAAAYRLRCLLGPAAEIVVFEQSGRLGGKLCTIEFAGRPYDVGAEAFLVRRAEVVELLTELGMLDELIHPAPVGASMRAGGRTNPMPGRTLLGVPASADAVRDVLSPEAVRRVAAEPSLPPVRLDGDVSVGALVRERFGDEVIDRLVDPLLGGIYAGRADALGLRATIPTLAGALDSGVGSLVAAAAALTPRVWTLGAGQPRTPVFGTLRHGLGSLIDRLAEASGARLRLGGTVTGLTRVDCTWRVHLGSDTVAVDGVVVAAPAPAAGKLLAEVAPAAATEFAAIEVASMAVVSLALPAGTRLPANSGVLIASGDRRQDGMPFTVKAFTYSSRKWAHLDSTGPVLVRGSIGRVRETAVLQVDDADLIAAARSDLAELAGVAAEPVQASVTRWGGGLPQYDVGHVGRRSRIEAAVAEVPGLAVAGASLRGVGVPGCLATAQAAAARVAAHILGRYRQPSGTMGSCPA